MASRLGARVASSVRDAASLGIDYAAWGLFFRKVAGRRVPPPRLIYEVQGWWRPGTAAFRYVLTGNQTYETLRALLLRNGADTAGDILDFGCGSGRVIRWFTDHPGRVVGSDYNPRLVDWCRRSLRGFTFDINGFDPPLGYSDDSFSLVYAFSVLTHLDEARQLAWLRELGRITRTNGAIVVTTHGSRFLGMLTDEERERFAAGELVVRAEGSEGSNDFWGFQPEQHFRGVVERAGLRVVDYLQWGSVGTGGQDLWLLSGTLASNAQHDMVQSND